MKTVNNKKRSLVIQNTVIAVAVIAVFGFFIWTSVAKMQVRNPDVYYIDTATLGTYMSEHAAGGVE